MLLYTSKGVTATNQFKVHGQLPLHGMIVSIQTVLLFFFKLHQAWKVSAMTRGTLSQERVG